ncbi:hypothetical protein FRC19_000631, partial [Serendipita sp. 401]
MTDLFLSRQSISALIVQCTSPYHSFPITPSLMKIPRLATRDFAVLLGLRMCAIWGSRPWTSAVLYTGCLICTLASLTSITIALAKVSRTYHYFPPLKVCYTSQPLSPWLWASFFLPIMAFDILIFVLTVWNAFVGREGEEDHHRQHPIDIHNAGNTGIDINMDTDVATHASTAADTNTPIFVNANNKKSKSKSRSRSNGRGGRSRMRTTMIGRVRGGTLAMLMWRDGAIYFSLIFASELACVIISAVWGFQKTVIIKFAVWALQNVAIAHMTLNLVEAVRRPETEMIQTSFFNPSQRDLNAISGRPSMASVRRSRRSFGVGGGGGGSGLDSPIRFESGPSSPVTFSRGTLSLPYHETSRTRLVSGSSTNANANANAVAGPSSSAPSPYFKYVEDSQKEPSSSSPFFLHDESPFKSTFEPPTPASHPFLFLSTDHNQNQNHNHSKQDDYSPS